jgi:hypothetical protein
VLLRLDDRAARQRLKQADVGVELARVALKQAEAERDTAEKACQRERTRPSEVRRQAELARISHHPMPCHDFSGVGRERAGPWVRISAACGSRRLFSRGPLPVEAPFFQESPLRTHPGRLPRHEVLARTSVPQHPLP